MKRLVATALVMIITAVVGLANFDVSQAQQLTQNKELKCAILIIQNSTSLIQLNQKYAVFQNQ